MFGYVCGFFQEVSEEPVKQKKVKSVSKFLAACRAEISKTDGGGDPGDLYPVTRLMLPQLDRDRGSYGVKETMLAKLFVDMLKLGPNSADATRLKNYRAPTAGTGGGSGHGDFGTVLYSVIKDRSYDSVSTKISVSEVNSKLDEIADANAGVRAEGSSKKSSVERVLMDIFRKMTAVQVKWFVRLVLKDMRLGVGQNTILGQIHPDARELYDVNASLKKVCQTLRDPTVRMNEIEISLFDPFKPMLADRPPASFDFDAVRTNQLGPGEEFYIETKYDGERMQLHKNGRKYRFFSRNGMDFTDDFGHSSSSGSGKFATWAEKAVDPKVKTLILDGEICAFNHITDSVCPKGQQMDIRHLGPDHPTYQQCLYVYDILLVNDKVLTNKPLRERAKILRDVVHPIPGRVQFSDIKIGKTSKDITDALFEAIDRRDEGIMLKDPESVYKPNARAGGGWLKIKPEYSNDLMDQCDLLVMGGYYGRGRARGVTHFLLGVLDEDATVVRSVARVGSGYSKQELFELMQKISRYFEVCKDKAPPSKLRMGKEKPDVWIPPEKSVVLQVKAAEVIHSASLDAKLSLRFPRVEAIRSDKSWKECMTLDELKQLSCPTTGKLFKQGLSAEHTQAAAADHGNDPPKKKRRKIDVSINPTQPPLVRVKYTAVDRSGIDELSERLAGQVIVVEPGPDKSDLEKIALGHGATVEQNAVKGRTTKYITTGGKLRSQAVIKSEMCDVLKQDWLWDCSQDYRDPRPSDMVFTTPATDALFRTRHYDAFDDSHVEDATLDSLKHSMRKVASMGQTAVVTKEAIAEFAFENFTSPETGKLRMFHLVSAYFDPSVSIPSKSLVSGLLKFYGGTIVESLQPGVTHVIASRGTPSERMTELKDIRKNAFPLTELFRIVDCDFVKRSVDCGERLDESDFEL